jgi:hypothetical protein
LKKYPFTRRQTLAFAGLFFLLSLIILALFSSWIRTLLLQPILYFSWLAALLLNSIDQGVLWFAIPLLAVLILGLHLLGMRYVAPEPEEDGRILRSQGRLGHWLAYINLTRRGIYSQQFFNEEIRRLILHILSDRERSNTREIEARISSGEIELPQAVREIITRPRGYSTTPAKAFKTRVLNWIAGRPLDPHPQETQFDLEAIISYLEELTEAA